MGALALAALLLTGAVPVDAYAAMIGVEGEHCPHHGKACNCPDACPRTSAEAAPAPDVPACHRKAQAERPDCTMSRCGGVEVPSFVVTGHDPFVRFTLDSSSFREAWERAFIEAISTPPSEACAPTSPPPRLLPTMIG